jgi:hypothetical protein
MTGDGSGMAEQALVKMTVSTKRGVTLAIFITLNNKRWGE